MDNKIPFTSYDFWAYLTAGFVLLIAIDQVAATGMLTRESWTVVQGAMAFAFAYVVGQLAASMSALLLEQWLVRRLLGHPQVVLFGKPRAWKFIRSTLPTYFEPLPRGTQDAVRAKATRAGLATHDDALFRLAYTKARTIPIVSTRLENFLNLYGFCRNVALVALVDAAIFYWSYWHGGSDEHLTYARVAAIIGIGMILRYLKFLKHYAVEVFTSYAYMTELQSGG